MWFSAFAGYNGTVSVSFRVDSKMLAA